MEEPALVVPNQGLRVSLYNRPNWVRSSLSLYYPKTDADQVYKMVWVFNPLRTRGIHVIQSDQKVSVQLMITVQRTCINILNNFNHLL
jgi:hypothetical protein